MTGVETWTAPSHAAAWRCQVEEEGYGYLHHLYDGVEVQVGSQARKQLSPTMQRLAEGW